MECPYCPNEMERLIVRNRTVKLSGKGEQMIRKIKEEVNFQIFKI